MKPRTADNQSKDGERCRDCGERFAEHYIRWGYCPTCLYFAVVEADHPGGLRAYQRQERYFTESRDGNIYMSNATRKPRVGLEVGPPHYLNMTPPRIADRLGMSSGLTKLTQEGVGRSMRKELMQTPMTESASRLLTAKEAEAVALYVDGDLTMLEVGQRLGVSKVAIWKRLKSALRKIRGEGVTVSMPADEIEDLEAAGQVIGVL